MYLGPVPASQIPRRDGEAFAKRYGDALIPLTADSAFADRDSFSAIVTAGVAAFEAETENLRAQAKSEQWIAFWLEAASGHFTQRVKQLHILNRPPQP
jgi:hypothetical protein